MEEEDVCASKLKHLLILILTSRAQCLKDMQDLIRNLPNTGSKIQLVGFDSTQQRDTRIQLELNKGRFYSRDLIKISTNIVDVIFNFIIILSVFSLIDRSQNLNKLCLDGSSHENPGYVSTDQSKYDLFSYT